ncbi:hypothetical protein B0H14DRAFT_3648214 [Mycena olivaceomarginata]|nr:hypothetical protein B0H14DRAFT_3648214 [Mycena olivaceomarginata]
MFGDDAGPNYRVGAPTEPQIHLHVKCHLRATPRDHIPESALAVLHSYETQGHPAPMKTYTSTIAFLYSTHLSLGRAQAWDLFSHMRYVAHPKPDVVLYTAMIRAARSTSGRRMTVEQGLLPTVGSYNAVILACAKSGRKEYVNEAFRIAKQMLDSNRDAYWALGVPARPRHTLRAVGRLPRRRGANEEIMMHVFHTYTSYVPPFTRNLAMVVPGREQKESTAAESDIAASSDAATHAPPPAAHPPRFTRIPPQTSHEVMEEVQALFQRILEDTGKARGESTPDNLFAGEEKFQHHSSLEASEALFWKVFDDVGVTPDARSYLEALERCSRSKRGRERPIGLQVRRERVVRNGWLSKTRGVPAVVQVDARMVERAQVAFMRVLVLNGQLQRALDLIRAFAERYPPSHIYERRPKEGFRSTKTVLVGARPLIRLSSPNEVPDDSVPPFLMFNDLEILHHQPSRSLDEIRDRVHQVLFQKHTSGRFGVEGTRP